MNFKNLRLWVFLFGVVFLIAAFLFQQSRENRKQLQLQSMVSIELTKQNFLETFDNYHSQLNSYLKRKFGKLHPTLDSAASQRMSEIFQDVKKDYKIQKIEFLSQSSLKDPVEELTINFLQPDSTWLEVENFVFRLDTTYNLQCDNLRQDREIGRSINCDHTEGIKAFKISHVVDLFQIMQYNRINDFFDAIYITDSTGVILYPADAIGQDLFASATLWENESSSDAEEPVLKIGNQHATLNISSVDHEVFSTKIKLGNQKLYILGAKKSGDFDQVALRINFYLLSLFILGLLFIFASIPIISILKMDKGDILSKGKVYGTGLSLILLMVLLGFSFSFSKQPLQEKGYRQKVLEIAEEYKGQIKTFVELVEGKKTAEGQFISQTNELIKFDSKGVIKQLIVKELSDTLDFTTNLFSIANRDYAKQLFMAEYDSSEYYTSAHYSQSTGKLEGVISKKMTAQSGKALTFKVGNFLASHKEKHPFFIFKQNSGSIIYYSDLLNIPVKTLKDAVGPSKWAEINTLIKNNRSMEKDFSLDLPLYVNGYQYDGILAKINLDLFDQSLWVLFLVDQSLEHTKISVEAIEASIFLLVYFLLLLLLSFLNSLANKQSIYLNIKTFSYSWVGPSLKKRIWFIFLNYMLFFDMVFFVILVLGMGRLDIFLVFLLSTLFALHANLSKFILIYPKPGQRFSNIGLYFILPALVLFFINLDLIRHYLFIKLGSVPLYVTIVLTLMIFMLLFTFILKVKEAIGKRINFIIFPFQRTIDRAFSKAWHKISGEHNDILIIFAISFVFSAILVGLIPGYAIHRAVTHHENHLWNMPESPQLATTEIPKPTHKPEFEKIIRDFEKNRRNFFGDIINQENTRIANFLAPDLVHLRSFFTDKQEEKHAASQLPSADIDLTQQLLHLLVSLLFVTVLGAICILVIFLTQRIYLTEYLFTQNLYHLPQACKNSFKNFIVSIDNRAAVDWIAYHFGLNADEWVSYDFLEHPTDQDFTFEKNKVIVLQNIHCFKNLNVLVPPLIKLLNKCIQQKTPLFITSGSSLKDLLGFLSEREEKRMVSEMFSDFISYTIPINFSRSSYNLPFPPLSVEKTVLGQKKLKDQQFIILKCEVNYGVNSHQISSLTTEEILCDPLDSKMSRERFEKILLTIQRHNKGYYLNIWNELNQMERKMVYYYSREGFINYTNRDILTELIQKGIFTLNVYDDGLVLFSNSFRNFVSLMVSEKEIIQFKEDERRHGNVANIRTAAFSFIFLSIAMISYYDPSVLNKTSAYVSGVIGLIGTIISFLSKGLGVFSLGRKDEAD